MNLLAVDTTGEPLSLSLRRGEKVFALHRKFKRPHDEVLLPQIDRLLERAGLTLKDLDAIAVASGPGRFTGIRVGMAYAAVAAAALKIPAIAVSRLEGAAYRGAGKLICAVVPGWREERFYQLFRGGKSMKAAAPPVWADPKVWHDVQADLIRQEAVISECDPQAKDLLTPAARYFALKKKPRFEPLYLKPASYEAKHPSRPAR
jgi:tRNA threonylcarbamoyl adenosine modification protein YeaZ